MFSFILNLQLQKVSLNTVNYFSYSPPALSLIYYKYHLYYPFLSFFFILVQHNTIQHSIVQISTNPKLENQQPKPPNSN